MANFIMKDEGYSFRYVYLNRKKVGQVLKMAKTEANPYLRYKAIIKGTEYISTISMQHAFHECVARQQGYKNLAARNEDVRARNAIIRAKNKFIKDEVDQYGVIGSLDRAFARMGNRSGLNTGTTKQFNRSKI